MLLLATKSENLGAIAGPKVFEPCVTLTVPFSTLMYKQVPVNLMLEVTMQ